MSQAGQSWGRYPDAKQSIIAISDRHHGLPATAETILPYGNGRSYGDSCLNDGGVLLHTSHLDRFIRLDVATGVLDCEAGALFSEILDLIVPQGWFLPVTPGTKFVSVGGAIANDVHGKNHHRAGTFGRHVLELELLRSDGSRRVCSATQYPEWFAATIGGLGLTGLITRASIQLRRIASPWMSTEVHRFDDLAGFFQLSESSDRDYEYTVAWIDCAAKGRALGRGLFTRADHAPACPDRRPSAPARHLRVPFVPPISLINPFTLRAFNALYYHRQRQPIVRATTHYEPQFYPLDGIRDWNRIYGPRGFMQYQCVVPPTAAEDCIVRLARIIGSAGGGSFLAVLKQFGALPSPGMLSFPRAGATLALDFPNNGNRTLRLLNELDDVVAASGGAVYPAKDARMSGHRFRQYFPAWESFSQFIDPRFSSSFWRRVME
ncbi:FAD-binding oxidoreductase [Rhodanobacter sp. MP7CTX1]|uniref:FAD-binding oxidoreductase n=1 Tax=Rhodanobacter sp. MP7CTX1 TaxID=2723084 RepID=UPI00161F3F4F|nr:FAD-binding oxidoreductase [Rhodanobacter sp. MP7CTX1]MBB6187483.1 FAD/FMN-containing dehydrogenase [Rhodanobacter sp. MP7CTX1]